LFEEEEVAVEEEGFGFEGGEEDEFLVVGGGAGDGGFVG
jgi:hypothetical protein